MDKDKISSHVTSRKILCLRNVCDFNAGFSFLADLIYKEVVDYESREHNAVGNAMHNHNPSK